MGHKKAIELVRDPTFHLNIPNLYQAIFVDMRGTWGFFMGATHGGMVDAQFAGFAYPNLFSFPIFLAIIYLFLRNLFLSGFMIKKFHKLSVKRWMKYPNKNEK